MLVFLQPERCQMQPSDELAVAKARVRSGLLWRGSSRRADKLGFRQGRKGVLFVSETPQKSGVRCVRVQALSLSSSIDFGFVLVSGVVQQPVIG